MLRILDTINAKVSISGRMRLLGLLMVLPVLFTGFLLYISHMKTVNFARTEMRGAQYLDAVWPAMTNGATGSSLPSDQIEVLTASANLNTNMIEPSKAEKLIDMSGEPLLKAANGLIADITDKSNLILDPDLDSFYMMDTVAVKMPQLIMAGRALYNTREAADTDVAHQTDEVTFDNAVAAVKDSLLKSGSYTSRKALSGDTSVKLDALMNVATSFRKARSDANYDQFLRASDDLFIPSNRDLKAMLQARVDKNIALMLTELGLAALVLLLGLGMTFVIAKGLSRRLTVLSGLMQRLIKGETVSDIPYQQDRHETGVIVETLGAFQTNLAETEGMRLNQHRLEEEAITSRRQAMLDMADRFESSVLNIVESLGNRLRRWVIPPRS
ncbi:MAG: hypothetical protein WBQ60_02905 [Asticcacaulis sp.]